jgi:hypothetical protein
MNRWKTLAFSGLVGIALASPARAHDPEQDMQVMLEAKLEQAWVKNNGFTADYERAQETALKTRRPIFAYFTVSYREVPRCLEVEKGVLASPEFRKFGEGVVLFVHVASGIDGKYSDLLSQKCGFALPAFMVLDEQGNVLAKVSGTFDVPNFEMAVKSGLEYGALRKKADKTLEESVEVLARDMDLGNLKLPRAQELAVKLAETSDAQKKRIAEALLRLEIWTVAAGTRDSFEAAQAAGKVFAEMWAAGREPTTADHAEPFFRLMLEHAVATKDAKLFTRALDKLRERFSEKPGWASFEKWQGKRLDELEAAEADGKTKDAGGGR